MILTIAAPVSAPVVSMICLTSSNYVFEGDHIYLQYEERAADGSTLANKNISLSPAQVSAFLDSAHPGATLRQAFAGAFVAALQLVYGAVTVTAA